MTKFDKINSEAIYELHYQEDMRAKGIPYQVSNLVIYTAISALEKQIPKKPTGIYDENESEKDKRLYEEALIGSCPVCHQEVQLGMKYCMNCGQKLSWE